MAINLIIGPGSCKIKSAPTSGCLSGQPPHKLPPRPGSTPAAQVIGDVTIGERASVWCNTVVRGDREFHPHRQRNQHPGPVHPARQSPPPGQPDSGAGADHRRPGNRGHNVILHGCEIGDECLIGMGSIVMDKVVLQPRVLLGAGSLVPEGKVLESGYLFWATRETVTAADRRGTGVLCLFRSPLCQALANNHRQSDPESRSNQQGNSHEHQDHYHHPVHRPETRHLGDCARRSRCSSRRTT